jgi:AcrR family transcriptional regulator
MTDGPKAMRADARATRERILTAAAVVLREDPTASLADIAAHADVGRATVYRHFPTLEALRVAIVKEAEAIGKRIVDEELGPLLRGEATGQTTTALLRQLLERGLTIDEGREDLTFVEPAPHDALITTFAPLATAMIKRGIKSGEFRTSASPDALGDALAALVIHMARRTRADGLPVKDALDAVMTFVRGFTAPGGTPVVGRAGAGEDG